MIDELIAWGFEYHFEQLYRQFDAGQISLEYFANQLGLNVRDPYALLEERRLPISNIQR